MPSKAADAIANRTMADTLAKTIPDLVPIPRAGHRRETPGSEYCPSEIQIGFERTCAALHALIPRARGAGK